MNLRFGIEIPSTNHFVHIGPTGTPCFPAGPLAQEGIVYDVLYLDQASQTRVIAAGLGRDSAVTVARAEARRRRVGRMFLAGSEPSPRGEVVLIVAAHRRAA
jgi:hypothetical protein